jgi:carboxypeptidase C (cathepsin A)
MTRGETAGGVTAASAISALQEAGGKITRLRTSVLNHGFARIVEQVMWLMHQFYDDNRRIMISGRSSEIDASPKHLFGESKGAYPAPPYSVQVQVSRRNPLRVQAQNDLFLQAYSMSAQAGTNFPLTTLFQLLNVDGKDKILPVLEQNEKTTQLIQSMQQQIEQLTMAGQEQQKQMASLQQTIAKQNQALARGQAVQYDPIGLNADQET